MPRGRRASNHWTDTPTKAAAQATKGVAVVDSILSFVQDRQGQPSGAERNLFMASVAFTYGVWENYVEQLAIELVDHLSDELPPELVPSAAREDFCQKADPWEIAISPGWKALWRQRVRKLAVGDDRDHGINTAGVGQIAGVFRIVGVDPLADVSAESVKKISELIKLRGEIVHTSQVPTSLKKAGSKAWRDFIAELVVVVDGTARAGCASLLSGG